MLTGNVRYDDLEFPENYIVVQVLLALGKLKELVSEICLL